MANDELKLLQWLQEETSTSPLVTLGLGDDLAILSGGGTQLLLGTDLVVEGTHFDLRQHTLEQVGGKAINAAISDCAAMAVQPVAALVSLVLPRGQVWAMGQPLLASMMTAASACDCAIIGGDTTSGLGPLTIDITIVGQPWPGITPIRRNGARPDDLLAVTGPLGGSILGHHLNFTPRVGEARLLAECLGDRLHALLDISDGLSLDAWRIGHASQCGIILDEKFLQAVISADAQLLAERDGRSPLDHALSDGEDYELLLAIDPSAGSILPTLPVKIYFVGQCSHRGLQLRKMDGTIEELTPRGWVH
ncbi:MAG: Thiamine-monophosphate kinase [Phycisphaerae bacterium]|nr:Thiamine-monophosphate kinase [Phycisphaerae bacterium]